MTNVPTEAPLPKPKKQPKTTRIGEVVLPDGRVGIEYSDGTIRNEKGQAMVSPPALVEHAITSDTAHGMILSREMKRNRLYAEGAQLAVLNRELIEKYGPDAHVVERAMTLQTIASTADAGKAAVMADQQLQRAQGYDVKDEGTPEAIGAVTDLVRELAAFARTLSAGDARLPADVVDAVPDA